MGANAKEFEGKKCEGLDEEDQSRFLACQIGAVQLLNATDDVALEVFHRLNAHGLSVNHQELRHGRYQGGRYRGEFRKAVVEASDRWVVLWEKYKVVAVRVRVRMIDHEFMAQMFGVLLEGVTDGGQPSINRLYGKYDDAVPANAITHLNDTVQYILEFFHEPT